MSQVITYQSKSGETIDLARDQIAFLEAEDRWPTDSHGWEFLDIIHGLHPGFPTFHNNHLRKLVGLHHDCKETPALSQEPFPQDPEDHRSGFYTDENAELARWVDDHQ